MRSDRHQYFDNAPAIDWLGCRERRAATVESSRGVARSPQWCWWCPVLKGTSCNATRMKAGGSTAAVRQHNASVLVAVLLSEIHKVSVQYGMQSGKCLLANCTSDLAPKATIFSLPTISISTYLPTYLPFYPPTYLPGHNTLLPLFM